MGISDSRTAHRTPPGSFALRESEASATNVFCAKAKRQQQMFYLCESEAAATNVFCAKAKRQQQMFYLRESEASAAKRPAVTEITPSL